MTTRTAGPGRRPFLIGTVRLGALALAARATASETLLPVDDLAPGQFICHPERQPEGPVGIAVSLDQHRVHVYRNGERIAVSTCSTGKAGHGTPTGVFVILQKDRTQGRALVIRNDIQIDEGGMTVLGDSHIGRHAFVLQPGGTGLELHVIAHHDLAGEPPRSDADLLCGTALEKPLARRVAGLMHPGMILILTETPLTPESRSGKDFVILNTDDA